MYKSTLLTSIPVCAALILSACSNNNSSPSTSTSTFNPDSMEEETTGDPGGDTTAIAGLWDGTTTLNDASDVVYWNLAANGLLTRYDYQQDGGSGASGENCYLVGQPITVTPEGEDAYSIFNVAVTATRNNDTLTIAFNEADRHDLDANGNVEEIPTFNWPLLTTPSLTDLNTCTSGAETPPATNSDTTESGVSTETATSDGAPVSDGNNNENDNIPPADAGLGMVRPNDSSEPSDILLPTADRPLMTRAECATNGGTIIGDIGDGAIHRPEYRCESGLEPIARITYLEGEPIATDGEVCCV